MNIIKSKNLTWIDIMPPSEKDVEYLKNNFSFHPFILKSIIPPFRHPRFENYGDYLFLVLHFPFFEKKNEETRSKELDILITKDTIITIHYQNITPLKALSIRLSLYEKEKIEFTDEGVGELVYRIINECLKNSFPKLDHIDEKIDEIEKEILKEKEKKMIEKVSTLKHDLINFQRIVRPQTSVFEALKQSSEKFFGKKFYPYFSELFNCFSTIKEVLETHHKTLNELEETSSSLLSTKTNEIIKTLTIFTVALTPATLIASIYGMNMSKMPLIEKENAFWIIVVIISTVFISTIVYIKSKKWLN